MTFSITATSDPDALASAPGAYLLLLRLDRTIALPRTFHGAQLPEGRYIYAGSAYGPGGVRARCRRHLARRGVRHWHIDWLTHAAAEVSAAAFPGGSECALIKRLNSLPAIQVPVPGFGSSDCWDCAAHLVHVQDVSVHEAIFHEACLARQR